VRRLQLAGLLLALPLLAAADSHRDLGKKEGTCRPHERGPALIVKAVGLKDRAGNLKLEVYPAEDPDFLAPDAELVAAGKVFRRVEVPVPAAAEPLLCIRVPAPGTYTLVLLHDRDGDHRFEWQGDGIGFGSNPRLGLGQPKAAEARVIAGRGLTRVTIVLNYLRAMRMQPLKD
jgi:uncharacterized protein (DUF2141 family)